MKKQLLKKLSAFIVTAMLFSASANAQIVYTDINPDISVTRAAVLLSGSITSVQNLDVNNDGILDLSFTLRSVRIPGQRPRQVIAIIGSISANPLNGSAILSGSSGYPAKMSLNSIINANANWSTVTNQLIFEKKLSNGATTTNTGNWNTATDGFLGLRFIAGGQTHYCWIQLSAEAFTSGANAAILTIKDYAFNSVSNQPILAGETSCTTPTVNLTRIGALSFCNGDSVTFTANGTGYQYQWRKNNTNIAGATSASYVAKTAGTYSCRVTNSCGSKTSAGKVVTVPCRSTNENFTEQLESPLELTIAPNPISSSTTITFSLEQSENISLKIFDMNGRLIKILASTNFNEGEHVIVLNAEELNEGVYLLQVQSAQFSKTEKLIVAR